MTDPVIEVRGLTVRFGGHLALDDVDFAVRRGEVQSIMGENGAGKSTLAKALSGALRPDGGEVLLDGRPVRFASPARAIEAGIAAVHQEFSLLPHLSVAENIMLGAEVRGRWGIDRRATELRARAQLDRLRLRIDPGSRLGDHPVAVRQLVAFARALRSSPRVLVLDEVTASVSEPDAAMIFDVVRALCRDGVAVVFVSHLLEHVYEIADRITVLRGGALVGEFPTRDVLRRDLVGHMLGRDPREFEDLIGRPREVAAEGSSPALLSAVGVRTRDLRHALDLEIGEGEVVGVAGLLGSGRTELARVLAGIDPAQSGRVFGGVMATALRSPRAALEARVAYASQDRRAEGIVAELTVRDNILLALQAQRGWMRRIPRAHQDELVASYIEALNIWPTDPDAAAGTLSEGNQQKVLLARWLAIAPRVLILDEPTRGIDIGAKVEVQRLVASLAANAVSVVYISPELDEILRLSDRVVVMRDRKVVAVLPAEDLDRDTLLALMSEEDPDGTT